MQCRVLRTLCSLSQLINGGEDVLIFYNDRASFPVLLQMMCSERDRADESGPLAYHITLVELLAACTEGKNVYTEIKCNSLLPLDDIVRVVTHDDCIPEVRSLMAGASRLSIFRKQAMFGCYNALTS